MNKKLVPKGIDKEEWKEMSLMQKFSSSFKDDPWGIRTSLWPSRAAIFLLWWSATTELYCFIRYIIPEYFTDYDPMTRYYMKVCMTLLFIEIAVNWICLTLYDTSNQKSPDNPQGEGLTSLPMDRNNGNSKDIILEDIHSDRSGLVWGYCEICELPKPPRAHHCKVCNTCILKRDHHCYFSGCCVGFYNQRYFVIAMFYMSIGAFIGLIGPVVYLNWKLGEQSTWWDYFLPNTFGKWWNGEFPIHYVILVGHLYTYFWALPIATGFFTTQMYAISSGKTSYEIATKARTKILKDSAHNLRSVFGAYWGFNFIFPAILIFRQEGNGKHWTDIKKY